MADRILLSHGAGSNRNAPLLVAVEAALSAAGVEAERFDLAFRRLRPGGPPRPGDAERDRADLRALIEAKQAPGDRVFLGGHSYGGRQSTILASEFPGLITGLLLLSYPLHPPRKPAELRTAHFPALRTPCLFIHGARDPFGSNEEMTAAIARIPARTRIVEIPGAGHELSRRSGGLVEVAERVAAEFESFFHAA